MLSNRTSRFLSSEQRAAIYGSYSAMNSGSNYASYQDIANLYSDLGINKSTVFDIVKKYEQTGNFADKERSGRPPIFNSQDASILKETLKQPHGSIPMAIKNIEEQTGHHFSDTSLSHHARDIGLVFKEKEIEGAEQLTSE